MRKKWALNDSNRKTKQKKPLPRASRYRDLDICSVYLLAEMDPDLLVQWNTLCRTCIIYVLACLLYMQRQ